MKNIYKLLLSTIIILLIIKSTTFSQWSTDPTVNSPIRVDEYGQYQPKIVADDSGGAIIVWPDSREVYQYDYLPDIYAQKINKNGYIQWDSECVVVCNAKNEQHGPHIITDRSGGAIVAWYDYRNGVENSDVYVQRLDSEGNPLWTANGLAICNALGYQGIVRISSDGSGGAIVVWLDERSGSPALYCQRINSNGLTLWNSGGVQLASPPATSYQFSIISDGTGGCIVYWADNRSGGDYNIYVQRIDASGNIIWQEDGVEVCTVNENQHICSAVEDGSSGIIVFWIDSRNGGDNWDIYAQKADSSGNIMWQVNGQVVCTDTGTSSRAVSDGLGGAVLAYMSSCDDSNYDVYAQRVNNNGVKQWDSGGVAICTGKQVGNISANPIRSGDQAFIITWWDKRNDNYHDIYGQRINLLGQILWTQEGIGISTAANNQEFNSVCTDGSQGSIVVWQDNRSTNHNIYAQQINRDGEIGVVPQTDTIPPNSVTDLTISSVYASSTLITWTAPGDDGDQGTATTYDIRYSTSTITEANWATATQATGEPTPQAAGNTETFTISNLTPNTNYIFAIKTADEANNWSAISNLVRYDKFSEFIHVRAKIDGSDWFEMTNNTWRWQHRNLTIPEIHDGVDSTEVNDQKFLSDWPSGTSSGSYSAYNTVTGLQSLQTQFGANVEVSLEVIDSQGPITLEQIPTSANSYTFRIFMNDDDYGSHYFYEFRLWAREGISPSNTTDLALSTVSTSSVTLTWTSPGDDTTWGTASSYDIRYSTSNITEANWSSAQTITGTPSPQAAGNTETFTVSNLTQNVLYYFALKTGDEVPNWSALSNVLSTKTGTPASWHQSGTWTLTNSPYIVTDGVTVPASQTLTIEAGVEIRFNGYHTGIIINDGSLLANGTATNHIKFTSNQGLPNPGDWANISIFCCSSSVSTFNYCDFEYGGNAYAGQILGFYQAGNKTLNYCTISHSADRGVTVGAWSYPTFNYCTISNNNGFGIYNAAGMKMRNSTVTNNGSDGVRTGAVTDWQPSDFGTDSDPGMNTFRDNTGYDIWHGTDADLPAKYNYWGTEDATTIASHIHQDDSGVILYQPFIKYSETNAANTGSTISFNESGDGHGIDLNFSSLSGSGNVTVRQTNEQPPDAPCLNVCGHYLTIEIDESITSFSADITFHYTDDDAIGYTESAAYFGIAKFNSSTNTWQWLGGTVDAENNTVTVSGVTSFSTFALFRRIFGDITGDGYVDAADLQRLGDCWHQTNSGEFTAGTDAQFFNFNKNTDGGNQIIDAADLQVFGDCWHNGEQ